MTRLLHFALLVAVIAAGCGSEPERAGRSGGTLVVLSGADLETLDPAQTTSASIVNLLGSVHRALYHLRPDTGLIPQPDLATGPPRISEDQRTLTIRLRGGVRFAPPVDREVVAADVKYGMERLRLDSLGPTVGAQALTDVAKIEAPDPRTLVIRLKGPTAGALVPQLTIPVGVPVPPEHARPFDRMRRSTYGDHAVATGPYTAEQGPNRTIRLARNPNWDAKTDDRPAHLDAIEFRTGQSNPDVTVRQIIRGEGKAGSGLVTPPAVAARLSEDDRRALFHIPPADQVMLLALNTRRKTFSDPAVRRAAAQAVDREALLRTLGGELFGRPASHFIPPAVAGFGEVRVPALPDAPAPDGEIIELLAPDTQRTAAEVLAQDLEQAGFRVRRRVLNRETAYARCAKADSAPDACLFGIVLGTYDPAILFDNVLHSRAINPQQTLNFARLSDPGVDAAIDRAEAAADPQARARAWAAADELALATAAYVPLLWPRSPVPHSRDVVARGTFELDYAYSSLRRGARD